MKTCNTIAYTLGLLLYCLMFNLSAQTRPGSLRGTVTDAKTGESIPFANVVLKDDAGSVITGGTSNIDGTYNINPIKPGSYSVKVTFVGYATLKVQGVVISPNAPTIQNFKMKLDSSVLEEVVITYEAPMISKTKSSHVTVYDIQNMAVRDVTSVASQAVGVTQDAKGNTEARGARAESEVFYINGITVRGRPNESIAPIAKAAQRATPEEQFAGENYKQIPENEFLSTYYQALSTFGADVDVASYANTRRMLNQGSWPHPDAVRLEELINYFSYDLQEPKDEAPFGLTIDQRPCDWNPQHQLLRIGLQTESKPSADLPPSNLVFLLDVSGSMNMANKLPLLQNALRILVKNLRPEDRVALVVYAGAAGVVLESTPASDKNKIMEAIDRLQAGGSTAGGAGIQLAYAEARKNFDADYNNRVILATDGDFNVGVASEEGLIEMIEEERESGIFLSVLGFGSGNFQDAKMEQLADHGNGNYAYIDGLMEARKVLAEEMNANLHVVAKDTKFQIEFNPQKVAAYRLIGYENRLLEDEDFDDDTKDAGDIGAGHSVTVIYELIPRSAVGDSAWSEKPQLRYQNQGLNNQAYGNELALLKIRHKKPQAQKSSLTIHPITENISQDPDLAFVSAVIQYGLVLRRSDYAGFASLDKAIALAEDNLGADPHGYRREFIKLCKLAKDLE